MDHIFDYHLFNFSVILKYNSKFMSKLYLKIKFTSNLTFKLFLFLKMILMINRIPNSEPDYKRNN